MPQGSGRFFRDNAFLVAAVSLPVVVVGFFLLASIVPRWLVSAPAYDLLLHASGPYDQTLPRVAVDFIARNGRVEATIRPVPANGFPVPVALFSFDHETMNVREIPVDLPKDLAENDPPRTIVVDALTGRQVLAQAKAPDGYEFKTSNYRGTGIVGDLFGMGRYDSTTSLVNRGRVLPIELPFPYQDNYPVSVVGWLAD